MNVNDKKWFSSMGAEKLVEAEEREVKMLVGMNLTDREKNDLMFGKLLEAVPSDTVILDNATGEKMILLGFTSDEEDYDYVIVVDKDGEIHIRNVADVKVFLSAAQKQLLE